MLEKYGFKKSSMNDALLDPSKASLENMTNHRIQAELDEKRTATSPLPTNQNIFKTNTEE
ncbi:hypothetical protein [Caldalkalibacillus mannanilyticus]|uniref:hypothetical protein n=1 Tax=Caldalkalibacillus mannanilyticus TaxID=1418 RepID=UPI000468F9EB|nr:hypothetical protein [Caldalkalibacillus mannanilyticus]